MHNHGRYTVVLITAIISLISTIFIESSQPPLAIIAQTPGLDKVAHFITFGCLACLVYLAITRLKAKKWLPPFTISLVLIAIIGLSDELYQLLNPERAFDVYDFLADVSGALCFILLLKWRRALKRPVNLPPQLWPSTDMLGLRFGLGHWSALLEFPTFCHCFDGNTIFLQHTTLLNREPEG